MHSLLCTLSWFPCLDGSPTCLSLGGDLPGKTSKPVVCIEKLQSGCAFPRGTEKLKGTGTVKPAWAGPSSPGRDLPCQPQRFTSHLLAAGSSYGFQ